MALRWREMSNDRVGSQPEPHYRLAQATRGAQLCLSAIVETARPAAER